MYSPERGWTLAQLEPVWAWVFGEYEHLKKQYDDAVEEVKNQGPYPEEVTEFDEHLHRWGLLLMVLDREVDVLRTIGP